jgi:hypothetical protein
MKDPKELWSIGCQAVKEQMAVRRMEIGKCFWF